MTDINDIETQRTEPRDTPAEEFYGKNDSCYVRIQFCEEQNGYRFEVKNELMSRYNDGDEVPNDIKALTAFIRGMLEVALANPHEMYVLGNRAMNNDVIAQTEGLTDEQRKLLMEEPLGKA